MDADSKSLNAPPPAKPNVVGTLKQINAAASHCSRLIDALRTVSQPEYETAAHIKTILSIAVIQACSRLVDQIEIREAFEAKQTPDVHA